MKTTQKWSAWKLEECCDIIDSRRIPVNSEDREKRIGDIPYYGANGLQGYINDFIFDEPLILIAEDGGRFDEFATKPIAYRIEGKSWVNNHAHVLRSKAGFSQDAIFYALEHKDIQPFIVGGTRSKLNQSALRSIVIELPENEPEQSKIAEVLSKVDQAIEQTEQLIAKQQRIKTGLMQDLLTRGIDEHGNIRSEETHEFKDSPLGRIPVEWEVKPFNDCVSIVEGQKDPRKFPYKEWILIAPDHIESKTGRLLETKTAFEQGAISGKYEFQSGDVIYSKIRPYLRKAVQVNFSGLCSADMYPLRPKELLTSDFLFLVILSEKFSLYAESVSERSGFPKINRTELSEFQMAIPKIDEQYKVSDFLVGHSQYVEELNKSLAKLRSLKTALMQDLLTGKVRVTPLMEKNGQNSEKNFKKECCYVCKE